MQCQKYMTGQSVRSTFFFILTVLFWSIINTNLFKASDPYTLATNFAKKCIDKIVYDDQTRDLKNVAVVNK